MLRRQTTLRKQNSGYLTVDDDDVDEIQYAGVASHVASIDLLPWIDRGV
jgi:hypothetical protein